MVAWRKPSRRMVDAEAFRRLHQSATSHKPNREHIDFWFCLASIGLMGCSTQEGLTRFRLFIEAHHRNNDAFIELLKLNAERIDTRAETRLHELFKSEPIPVDGPIMIRAEIVTELREWIEGHEGGAIAKRIAA